METVGTKSENFEGINTNDVVPFCDALSSGWVIVFNYVDTVNHVIPFDSFNLIKNNLVIFRVMHHHLNELNETFKMEEKIEIPFPDQEFHWQLNRIMCPNLRVEVTFYKSLKEALVHAKTL
ncbi:MAG TPA: hypothetical protein VK172_10230 [Lentimicrobium sp.]|nr:hypothetical protein [Lentimicrobium sp.]